MSPMSLMTTNAASNSRLNSTMETTGQTNLTDTNSDPMNVMFPVNGSNGIKEQQEVIEVQILPQVS